MNFFKRIFGQSRPPKREVDMRVFAETLAMGDQEALTPMLRRFGIRDFDWKFIDVLLGHGDGTEMQNQNFLSLLRDRLQPLGLTLASIGLFGDRYGFVVLRPEDYQKIADYHSDQFRAGTDFGADKACERGKQILAEWERRS